MERPNPRLVKPSSTYAVELDADDLVEEAVPVAEPSTSDLLARAARLGPFRPSFESIALPNDPILAEKQQPEAAARRARFQKIVKATLGGCVALCALAICASLFSASDASASDARATQTSAPLAAAVPEPAKAPEPTPAPVAAPAPAPASPAAATPYVSTARSALKAPAKPARKVKRR